VGAHRVHHAERIGRITEVGEIAGQDRAVRAMKDGCESLDRTKRHVDVAEADESHGALLSATPALERIRPGASTMADSGDAHRDYAVKPGTEYALDAEPGRG
jgi:hypothetical protein